MKKLLLIVGLFYSLNAADFCQEVGILAGKTMAYRQKTLSGKELLKEKEKFNSDKLPKFILLDAYKYPLTQDIETIKSFQKFYEDLCLAMKEENLTK